MSQKHYSITNLTNSLSSSTINYDVILVYPFFSFIGYYPGAMGRVSINLFNSDQ